jgi:DNA-3-methyladenine glycosylase II
MADPVMASLLARYPEGIITSRGDPFYTLMRSISGQQISVKAADAVWGRVEALMQTGGGITPDTIQQLSDEALRACGLSRQKILYMRHLSAFFIEEQITPQHWDGMEDEAVIRHICQIKGIGRWTAEMFLIFCLLRPDVFPLDDIGLQRALHQQYALPQKPFPRADALQLAERWQPYRSVATWYLWRSIDPSDVGY